MSVRVPRQQRVRVISQKDRRLSGAGKDKTNFDDSKQQQKPSSRNFTGNVHVEGKNFSSPILWWWWWWWQGCSGYTRVGLGEWVGGEREAEKTRSRKAPAPRRSQFPSERLLETLSFSYSPNFLSLHFNIIFFHSPFD